MLKKKQGSIGIIGLGKFGMCLAQELVKCNKTIVCLDKDEAKVQKAMAFSEYCFVSEDLSTETLEEMGFKECTMIIVCIGEHMDTAILATLNALNLGVERVIAMSNTEELGLVLEKLGAEVIYPYIDSVDKLVKRIISDNLLDFISLNEEVEISEVAIPKSYIGKAIENTDIRSRYGLNIIALKRENAIKIKIDPKYILNSSDRLIVLGEKVQIRKFEAKR